MKRYTVRSKFKDAKGRDLFESKTFDGGAEDAKAALVAAHAEMARLGAEDSRVDCIASIVKGPNEEISTTDYLDELGRGMSGAGLMNEVAPEDLEQAKELNVSLGLPAGDGVLEAIEGAKELAEQQQLDALYGGGIGANRATGGVVPEADTFLGSDGRDTAKALQSGGEGIGAPLDSVPVTGGPVDAPAPGWNDPSANPLADIIAGKRRIEDESYGSPAWLTPIEEVKRPVNIHDEVKIGPGEHNVPVEIVLPEFTEESLKRLFGGDEIDAMWKAQRESLAEMYESGSKKYQQHILGRWADNE